jgi:hypothetical protein
MRRLSRIAVSACFIVTASNAYAAPPLAISTQGWTITADQGRGVLSISQQNLGLVLQDVRINLADQNAILPWPGGRSSEPVNPN